MLVGNSNYDSGMVKFKQEVEFDEGKATLKMKSKTTSQILGWLVDFMKQNTNVTKFRIEGHTDSNGPAAYNQTLSQQRADAVVSYLTSQGIDAGRLLAKGFGDTKPLVPNDTKEHQAMNRRVEFHLEGIAGKDPPSDLVVTGGAAAMPAPGPAAPGDQPKKKKEGK